MNSLVVYDSQFGNTKIVAEAMSDALKACGEAHTIHVNQVNPSQFRGVDLLILGCPIIQWKPSTAMQSLLERLQPQDLNGVKTAAFDTRMKIPRFIRGKGAEIIADRLEELGSRPILPPEGFLVASKEGPMRDGEVERAVQWALKLHDNYEASMVQSGSRSR
jgi:flavodoxin